MYTVGTLARKSGLSRTALLYYHRIGLLRPAGRNQAGYRLYSDDDLARLGKITLYRQAGLALADIGRILDCPSLNAGSAAVLERRLAAINDEIGKARRQQQLILQMIGHDRAAGKPRTLDRQDWTSLLRATGLSEQDMDRWHVEFERLSPEAHQDFLAALGMPEPDIVRLRHWAAGEAASAQTSDAPGEKADQGC